MLSPVALRAELRGQIVEAAVTMGSGWGSFGEVFGLCRNDSPVRVSRWFCCISRSRIASAIVASPTQACQCSTGSWLVMMVALLAARSSMISSRSYLA